MSNRVASVFVIAVLSLISVNATISILTLFSVELYNGTLKLLLSISVIVISALLLFSLKYYWKMSQTLEKAIVENRRQAAVLETNANKLNRFESKFLNLSKFDTNNHNYDSFASLSSGEKTFGAPLSNYELHQLDLNVGGGSSDSTSLPLSTESIQITWPVLLRALHFPNDPSDEEGFLALKIARQSNIISDVLRASEDLLNLLAQDGIYLDDLNIDQPPVEAWLNFVNSNKKGLSKKLDCIGIEDRIHSLKNRAKSDMVFRDTAMILIRRFDQMLKDRLQSADDNQVFNLAFTRTGIAFLIAGKVCNSF